MRLVLIVALAGCIAVASVSATERVVLSGRIVALADGDTLTLLTADRKQYRIRLDGIDAPERTQPYSQLSRKNLIALIGDQPVSVESSKVDWHGRAVGVVRNAAGQDVGLEQIKAGLAWHFKRYEHEQTPENRAGLGSGRTDCEIGGTPHAAGARFGALHIPVDARGVGALGEFSPPDPVQPFTLKEEKMLIELVDEQSQLPELTLEELDLVGGGGPPGICD